MGSPSSSMAQLVGVSGTLRAHRNKGRDERHLTISAVKRKGDVAGNAPRVDPRDVRTGSFARSRELHSRATQGVSIKKVRRLVMVSLATVMTSMPRATGAPVGPNAQ